MTRRELKGAVTRRIRFMGASLYFGLVWMFASIAAAIYRGFQLGRPDGMLDSVGVTLMVSSMALPLLCMLVFMVLWTKWPIRCPHCNAPLGREKKRVYDVTATGICRECGKGVVDEAD